MAKRTAEITLDNIKCTDGWAELGYELGFTSEEISKIFEYGEYGSLTIEVDENLNIVGGKIHPHEPINLNKKMIPNKKNRRVYSLLYYSGR